MAIATLSVDLVAKVARFEADLKRVATSSEQQGQRMAAAFGLAKNAIGGLVAGLSVGATFAVFRSVVDGIDALNDLSDATGSSIEKLSSLEQAAGSVGTSMQVVGDALIKLNQSLSAAKPGSDAERAFKALGLSVEELKRLDPADALRSAAVALSGFADDGNKARLTQALFGKSLKDVAPLLKDLVEVGERNAKVTTEQADAASVFNKQIAALGNNVTNTAREISGPLVRGLNELFASVKRFQANEGGFLGGFTEQLRVDFLREQLQGAKNELQRLAPGAEQARRNLAVQPDSFRSRAVLNDFAELQKAADDYQKKLDAILFAGKKGRPANEGGGSFNLPSLPDIATPEPKPKNVPRSTSAADQPLVGPTPDQALLDAIQAIENTDVAKVTALREQLQRLIDLRSAGGDVDGAIQATVEQITRLDPAAQAAAASAQKLQAILDQTPTAIFADVLSDVELLNAAFDDGQISAQVWGEAIRNATAKLGTDEAAEEIERLSEFAEQASRNIQDALGTTLESVLAGNFNSIGDLWKSLLIKMASQALAADLNKFLFGGAVGGGGGLLAGVFKLAGARADGGPVSAGKAYLVGERGPEIMVPGSSGTILPNGVGMGGVTINQTINVGQGVSRSEVYAAAMQAKDAAKAEIMQTMFRTGRAYA